MAPIDNPTVATIVQIVGVALLALLDALLLFKLCTIDTHHPEDDLDD